MYQITKKFKDYPFAHRQPDHDGHCRLVHGHNWTFAITLRAEDLDENGFVYDFGKFGWLKTWLENKFDHTLLINEGDPEKDVFMKMHREGLADIVIVDSCSSEGIAKMVYKKIKDSFREENPRNVRVVAVTVYEDQTNSATYTG